MKHTVRYMAANFFKSLSLFFVLLVVDEMSNLLNAEQHNILQSALRGHNLLISGQGGSGKSFLVKCIESQMRSQGRNVTVVSASGISCSVYDSLNASTVHSYYGLKTAELQWQKLVARSMTYQNIMKNVSETETLIWDEASLSSARIFEVCNAIEHALALKGNSANQKPFGGKQIILVGDFLQLRPVPSMFDGGKFLFDACLFKLSIPHRYQLMTLMRQINGGEAFQKALTELRLCQCSKETVALLTSLQRPLDDDVFKEATHIYFRKIPVALHNIREVYSLPGQIVSFDCQDSGRCEGISCPAPSKLLLKPSCKVMLVWNLSTSLKNGSQGTFLNVTENQQLAVEFPKVGKVCIGRQTWNKVDRNGKVVGQRTQFPLVPCYATTCHKAQGLTLPAVVVHCSQEFVSGLTYVAASRVKEDGHLQLIHFQEKKLLSPPPEALSLCDLNIPEAPNLECCRNQDLPVHLFCAEDVGDFLNSDDEDAEMPSRDEDGLAHSFFELLQCEGPVMDLESVLLTLTKPEHSLSSPPGTVDIKVYLRSLFLPDNEANESEFISRKNSEIDQLLQPGSAHKVEIFLEILWLKAFQSVEAHLKENLDDLMISKPQFTAAKSKMDNFTKSAEYFQMLMALFGTNILSPEHTSIGFCCCNYVFEQLVCALANAISNERNEGVPFKVLDMPVQGLAKIRYVGGWAIRKVLEACRKYVRDNMFSPAQATRENVEDRRAKCVLLEENVLVPFAVVEKEASNLETLQVTEDRQYRNRGLLHISDVAFNFFCKLEQKRVDSLNVTKLERTAKKEDFIESNLRSTLSDQDLKVRWHSCFEDGDKKQINELFGEVVTRYVRMGAGQFLRDFRRAYQLKKSAEHRKKVLQKKQRSAEKNEKVSIDEIHQDRSQGKSFSYGRLVAFSKKHGEAGVRRSYLKGELQKLCRAANVSFIAKDNKGLLARRLVRALQGNETYFPSSYYLDRLTAVIPTEVADGRIVIRIRR